MIDYCTYMYVYSCSNRSGVGRDCGPPGGSISNHIVKAASSMPA